MCDNLKEAATNNETRKHISNVNKFVSLFNMLMIRVCVDYLGSAKSREDMLNYLIEDIAYKAGWILSKHRDIPFKHSLT